MESGKIIVVANQKGGVAKTSTVRNLSYALAEMGKKVLVVDFDPQYNLTTSFGVLPTQAPYNTGTLITNLLLDESLPDTNEFIQKIGSVDLIPSSRSLTVAEANLLMTPDSNDYLAALLNPLRLSYDYIIVDTNPSLGSLTINALTAADEVIIPIDPELFALTGLQALVDTIKKIKRKLNPSIEIGGILFTKCNKRTNLYRRTYGQVTKAFQSLPIFNCQIPYTVKVGDANSYGMSVMELEQANPASLAYARYFTSWEQITPVSFPNPMQNRIIENYCSGVYLSPDQVIQLLKDMEQDPKVLEDLEGLWSNGQIAVLKKALSAAAKSGVGLLEATEVVEPNPISPNESTSYSNLYHCDRDGVYLYIDAVSGQLADAIGKNEG